MFDLSLPFQFYWLEKKNQKKLTWRKNLTKLPGILATVLSVVFIFGIASYYFFHHNSDFLFLFLRSTSCVEYEEKAALQKHSVWSSVAVDVFLGNLIGLALLFHAESACFWVLRFVNNITNNLLRSGCVWLMGVPAGFKLNTELARVLGMISLNAIQIWSTIWVFLGFLFIYVIKGLAIFGIIFGVTIPAALIIDMIALATVHVSTLHWLMSLLYSQQIQAIAALWRLFR